MLRAEDACAQLGDGQLAVNGVPFYLTGRLRNSRMTNCSRVCGMKQEKLSVSVPAQLVKFVEDYKSEHGLATKSSVVERALEVLRARELERAYAQAAAEVDPAWDTTPGDGLANEGW